MPEPPPPPPPPGSPEFPSGPPSAPPPSAVPGATTPPAWVPPGAPPTSPPTGPPGPHAEDEVRGRRWPLVVAAILGVVVLLVATVAFVGDDGDPAVAPPATTPSTSEPSSAPTSPTSEPAPTPTTEPPGLSEAEFEAVVDELEAYVAAARGLDFLEDVVVELEDDAEFEARLLEDFEDDVDEIEDAEVFYRALGVLEGETTLLDALRGIFAAGVLGYYDPETNELVIRGTSMSPYVRQTIVHELVHALDDQHFELDRPQYEDRKDEIGTGFRAVVEGNASRIDNRWLGEQPADVRAEARAEERAFQQALDLSAFPELLVFEIAAPYQLGPNFVAQLLADGGERAVDVAITDPPETSEQVLFPDLYASRQARIEVPPPPAEGEVVDDGVVGALFLFALLTTGRSTVGETDAVRAVQGWGGDWFVTWEEGDLDCIRIDLVGDTDSDTDEIQTALEEWATSYESATIDRVDGRVRLESCVLSAGSAPPQA